MLSLRAECPCREASAAGPAPRSAGPRRGAGCFRPLPRLVASVLGVQVSHAVTSAQMPPFRTPVIAGQGHLHRSPRPASLPTLDVRIHRRVACGATDRPAAVFLTESLCASEAARCGRSDVLRKSGRMGAAGWQLGGRNAPAGLGPEQSPCGRGARVCGLRGVAETAVTWLPAEVLPLRFEAPGPD